MADDSLSLLFRLKAENTQAKAVMAATRQDVAQLRQAFGPQLTQTVTTANKAFGDLGTQLNSLVVQRVPFVSGALTQVTTSLGEVGAESAATGASIGAMAGPIGIAVAALAVMIAGVRTVAEELFDLTKKAAAFQGELADLSQQTNVSVEVLSAMELAIKQNGGQLTSVVQALTAFQRKMEEAIEDRGSKAAVVFQKLNVEISDTEQTLRDTIAALAAMPEGFQQTSNAAELFGQRGGKQMLLILKQMQGDLDGAIERMRELGILVTSDAAKIADDFNDQLELLSFQLRGLGVQTIPVVMGAVQSLSRFLEENRDLFNILQNIIKVVAATMTGALRLGFGLIKTEMEKMRPILTLVAALFERIKAAIEFIAGHPISLSGDSGSAIAGPGTTKPSQSAGEDPFLRDVRDEIEARRVLQAKLNFELAAESQKAQDAIAKVQRDLEAGRATRKQVVDETIAGLKKQTAAQIEQLKIGRGIKLREIALARDDVQKRQQLSNEILAIDTQVANKEAELRRDQANLRAKAQQEERKSELDHFQALTEITIKLGEQRISVIEDLIKREKVDRETALKEIENIENASIASRGQILKEELALAGVGPERQAVLDKIKAIETERTVLERSQAARRREISRTEFEEKRQILTSNLDALLQIQQIRGNAQIATLEAQAALRIKTEEQAAKEILAIRLDLLDSEIEATKAKLEAAGGIQDPKERRQAQAQLTNDLKILNAEREAIQAEGNRNIDAGRRQDIENERRYADELRSIREGINQIEREAAEEVIRLMILHFARRRDIIRAQAQLDIDEENRRNKQARDEIAALRRNVNESTRTQQEKLAALIEIDELEETEAERHRLTLEEIRRRAQLDEKNAEPLGRIGFDLDNLKEFASIIEDSIVPLGEILTRTFEQVADAIGQTVANWVLLGETGPAVMRKILAQALASIAAEAAVNAIKELALGFATLFFNPAESAAHFISAGLWGSIAGVSALAGRKVAGDLFKPKSGSGGGSGRSGNGELNPLSLARNAGPGSQPQAAPQVQPGLLRVEVNDGMFAKALKFVIVQDINNAGTIREVLAGDGNLNRG